MEKRVVDINVKLIDDLLRVGISQYQSNGFNIPKYSLRYACSIALTSASIFILLYESNEMD